MATVSVDLRLDLDNPPVDPPAGCVDPFMWTLALAHLDEHSRHGTEQCPDCADGLRCPGRALARQGLLTACGIDNPMTNYWHGLASIRHRQHLQELP